ncbi:MAG: diguanylate cyclase [Magnetococcales bacterium]|nr:diguanylate cyclase [Magnetococcales bacterium]
MNIKPFKRLLRRLLDNLLGGEQGNFQGLLFPWKQPELVSAQRVMLILSRVRLTAIAFAILTPLWIILDIAVFPDDIWTRLAIGRLLASAAFAMVPFLFRDSDRVRDAYLAIILLFSIPTLLFLYSHHLFATIQMTITGIGASFIAGYAFLPFVLVSGLSVFPLTALEGGAFVAPAILVELATGAFGQSLISPDARLGLIWLLILIGAVAVISGMSQLHYLSEIIVKSAHDPLTKVYNRATGSELLEKYFLLARRNGTPLSLLFFDLDHFKSINDHFGHDAGDQVLQNAALALKKAIRKEDLVVRWGGEEFLVVLPHITRMEPSFLIERLGREGLGMRPEGTPLTASMGLGEFTTDQPIHLNAFIELADQRMYRAKQSGRNRLCFGDEEGECFSPVFKPLPGSQHPATAKG